VNVVSMVDGILPTRQILCNTNFIPIFLIGVLATSVYVTRYHSIHMSGHDSIVRVNHVVLLTNLSAIGSFNFNPI
jgi:hypothetical protein